MPNDLRRSTAVLLVALAALGGGVTSSAAAPHKKRTKTSKPRPVRVALTSSGAVTPLPAGLRVFAPTSFWNAPLAATAPTDPGSPGLVAALNAEVQRQISAGRGPWINTNQWSVAAYTVGSGVPRVRVKLDAQAARLQTDFDSVPIPAGAKPAGGGDRSMTVYQPSTDTMWELWLAAQQPDGWHARYGGRMTGVSSNPGYFPRDAGATGTSLPLLGGLITINELKRGQINHALALALPNTAQNAFVWPAQRSDGRTPGPGAVPEGTRFRIDPSLDLTRLNLSPTGLAIARAVQRYGMVVRDTAGTVTFFAEDPGAVGGDPYGPIWHGAYPSKLLAGFPWQALKVVAPGR